MEKDSGMQDLVQAVQSIAMAVAGQKDPIWVPLTPVTGTVTTTLGCLLDANGFVHLRGQLNCSAATGTLFTLPAGYRPEQYKEFGTSIGGGFGVFGISTAGVVSKLTSNVGNVDFDTAIFQSAS